MLPKSLSIWSLTAHSSLLKCQPSRARALPAACAPWGPQTSALLQPLLPLPWHSSPSTKPGRRVQSLLPTETQHWIKWSECLTGIISLRSAGPLVNPHSHTVCSVLLLFYKWGNLGPQWTCICQVSSLSSASHLTPGSLVRFTFPNAGSTWWMEDHVVDGGPRGTMHVTSVHVLVPHICLFPSWWVSVSEYLHLPLPLHCP